MKQLLVLFTFFAAQSAMAALTVNCDVWGKKQGDPNLDISMVLPFTMDAKLKKMPTSPSVMTVIENNYSEDHKNQQNVVFSDSISHLNSNRSNTKGLFEEVTKNFYPIRPGTDPLHPTAEPFKVYQLSLHVDMLKQDHRNEALKLQNLNFSVVQFSPMDSTFIGTGDITYNGKKYEDLSYRCGVSIGFSYFQRLMTKK